MSDDLKMLTTISKESCKKLLKQGNFQAIGVLFARRIELKAISRVKHILSYCVFELPDDGLCIAFDYGALVFFNTEKSQRLKLCASLEEYADTPSDDQTTESMEVKITTNKNNIVSQDEIFIEGCTPELLQVIADVLSKSVKMDQFELTVADSFARVEPIARNLKEKGKLNHTSVELLKHIGSSLLTEHEMIGRIEMTEKPIVLWEHSEIEPLYHQLMDEFEIVERHAILDKKIELLARTAQTSLEVLQHGHASRLEWYIIILIMVSICLELYALFTH